LYGVRLVFSLYALLLLSNRAHFPWNDDTILILLAIRLTDLFTCLNILAFLDNFLSLGTSHLEPTFDVNTMCSRRPLLPIMVEHIAPLLRSLCSWSLLLVRTVVLGSRSGVLPWLRWSFLKGCTSADAGKMKYRDLAVFFNVILFYAEVSAVKGVLI
jgi:hypothetical protein